MRKLDKHATIKPATERGTFVEIRDPRTRKLLARYNSTTRELEVKPKGGAAVVVSLQLYEEAQRTMMRREPD